VEINTEFIRIKRDKYENFRNLPFCYYYERISCANTTKSNFCKHVILFRYVGGRKGGKFKTFKKFLNRYKLRIFYLKNRILLNRHFLHIISLSTVNNLRIL